MARYKILNQVNYNEISRLNFNCAPFKHAKQSASKVASLRFKLTSNKLLALLLGIF